MSLEIALQQTTAAINALIEVLKNGTAAPANPPPVIEAPVIHVPGPVPAEVKSGKVGKKKS